MSVGRNAEVGEGVRLREAIVLGGARVREHSLVLHAVLGWDSVVGAWARIEGTPCDPDPNKPFAKMDNVPLFSGGGKLNPSITILGEWCGALVGGQSATLLSSLTLLMWMLLTRGAESLSESESESPGVMATSQESESELIKLP